MISLMDMKQPSREMERCLDSQLWHACAGGMVQMPPVSSKIFYFPQGHVEHAHGSVDFGMLRNVPSYVPCRVSSIKYMADPDNDEVYAKIRLTPLRMNEIHIQDDVFTANNGLQGQDKPPASFAKTLTQSDANNGGGFSVPRYCAETIFPRLDYNADPPVQTILVKDVHAQIWKFRHIYRGTPRRHLLTTGWSNFVNHKKLVAGDSIVFLRAEDGDLCVGIRRAKRGIGGGLENSSGWNSSAGNFDPLYGGYSAFLREGENKLMGTTKSYGESRGKGKVRAESVIEAAKLASNGKSFEVVYYPRASTPEFCVKASSVRAAMRIQWCPGMRFKMAFETEDSSRISWFMGTISSVQVADPILWPNSPWRLLQVAWDEPDLLQNVKRVSPWLAELVSHIPAIHLSPFSPPRKKLRLPYPDNPLINQIPVPSFSNNPQRPSSPMFCLPLDNNIYAGIQGARHAHDYNLSSSDSLHLKKMQFGHFPIDYGISIPPRIPNCNFMGNSKNNEDVACLLSMGNCSTNKILKRDDETKMNPVFLLFGQPILTEEQISQSTSGGGDTVGTISSTDENLEKTPNLSNGTVENSSDDGLFPGYKNQLNSEFNFASGQCEVFLDSEDMGRVLDLTVLESYEELYGKLANMFGMEGSEMRSNLLYQDISGATKNIGDEPFSYFLEMARKLTILTDSSSDNNRAENKLLS